MSNGAILHAMGPTSRMHACSVNIKLLQCCILTQAKRAAMLATMVMACSCVACSTSPMQQRVAQQLHQLARRHQAQLLCNMLLHWRDASASACTHCTHDTAGTPAHSSCTWKGINLAQVWRQAACCKGPRRTGKQCCAHLCWQSCLLR